MEELLAVIASYADRCDFDAIIPISARKRDGLDVLLKQLKTYATESPQLFPDDMVTDQPERHLAAEILREKMMLCLDQEIPHGVAVEVTSFHNRQDGLIDIEFNIYCDKSTHKSIIIGKEGLMLKKISTMARSEIEHMLNAKVYMKTWVKVKENWRDSAFLIRNFGYE